MLMDDFIFFTGLRFGIKKTPFSREIPHTKK